MASSSSSHVESQDNVPLPLIPCPFCGGRVMTKIARGGDRPGVRYYKCEFFSTGGCKFFQWREVYARTLQDYGGIAGAPMVPAVAGQPHHAGAPSQQDLGRINLLVSLINTMAIMIVLAVLLATASATFNK